MKTLISKPTILFICALLLCFNYLYSQNDTIKTIPFVERFTEGSLEVNNWTKESDNWNINIENGTPKPSVRFNGAPAIDGIYSYSLTSDWISKLNSGILPSLYLRFDIIKSYNISSVIETLTIEILDSTEWKTVKSIYQFDSIYPTIYCNLESYLTKEHFRIRFRVSGINSSPGEYWEIDNIQVYRRCVAPENLSGSYFWDEENFGVQINWEDNQPLGCPEPLTWCSYNGTELGVGYTEEGEWTWAAKWLPSQLWGDSLPLCAVMAYSSDNQFDSIVLKVWQGEQGDILIYSKNVSDQVIPDEYNKHYIIPSLMIRDTSPLYVGFTAYNQTPGTFPAGLQDSESVVGFGNLVKLDNTSTWDTISNYGLDGNWSIYLYMSEGIFYEHNGYNIYRSEGDDSNYILYDFFDVQGNFYNSWYDNYPSIDMQTPYGYKVTNVYTYSGIIPPVTYESLPALVNNSDDDFVMVFVTGESESTDILNDISLYPNPGKNYLNIKSEFEIESIIIYNMSGEMVFEKNNLKETYVEYDISTFKSGVYLINIKTAVRVNTKKIVIQ